MSTTRPYGLVPGQLYDALQGTFSVDTELPLADLPADFGPPHAARHRFATEDGERLVQVGTGVLSVNHLAYVDYDSFSEDCDRVLEVADTLGLLETITRLGLRYINRAPLDRPWNEIVSFELRAPGIISSGARRHQVRLNSVFEGVGEMTTNLIWPLENEGGGGRFLLLDFDHFATGDWEVRQVADWRRAAHENVYAAFRASLRDSYFDFLASPKGTKT